MLDPSCIDLFEPYYDAVRAISVNSPSLRKALLGDASVVGLAGMIAKLQMTVKSHKECGDVTCRALHAYNGCPLSPGMRWMMSKLQPRLSQLPHLVVNSTDFMRKTQNLRLPHVCRFMKKCHATSNPKRVKRLPREVHTLTTYRRIFSAYRAHRRFWLYLGDL